MKKANLRISALFLAMFLLVPMLSAQACEVNSEDIDEAVHEHFYTWAYIGTELDPTDCTEDGHAIVNVLYGFCNCGSERYRYEFDHYEAHTMRMTGRLLEVQVNFDGGTLYYYETVCRRCNYYGYVTSSTPLF